MSSPQAKPVHPLVRSLALAIPPLRRLVEQRDRLWQELHGLRAQITHDRSTLLAAQRCVSLCEVMNPARYDDPEWLGLHHDLERYALDKHCFRNVSGEIYRKGWEWTHCLYGLRKLGMLQPHHKALGVGAGRESVIFYLADHIAKVVATDLYGEQSWVDNRGREADLALVEESKKFCPATVDLSKVTFENQDGTRLTYADNSFDFAWSLSSIEHFGGHDASAQAMREMARVVRPGGIVAVATEMMLLEEYRHPEYFARSELEHYIVGASPDLELVAPIDYEALPLPYLIDSITVPGSVERFRRHAVLNDGKVQWTSVMLFFRKKGG